MIKKSLHSAPHPLVPHDQELTVTHTVGRWSLGLQCAWLHTVPLHQSLRVIQLSRNMNNSRRHGTKPCTRLGTTSSELITTTVLRGGKDTNPVTRLGVTRCAVTSDALNADAWRISVCDSRSGRRNSMYLLELPLHTTYLITSLWITRRDEVMR